GEHGYGTWIARDEGGEHVGFVGLRAHSEFIRLTTRVLERVADERTAGRALRLASAHALEWLPPDLPVRIRLAPEGAATRSTVDAAGLVHVPAHAHVTADGAWQILEMPYVRVVDRVPARAREAMLDMWVRVNDTGGSVGFLPGASPQEVGPVLDGYIAGMAAGTTICVSLNSPLGELLGFGFVVRA